jgi:RES domain
MIEKVANNKYNTEKLNLNPPEKVKEKLDYYKSLFNGIHDLPIEAVDELAKDIKTFFNLKSVGFTNDPPERLVRISNNNRILASQGKSLSYLTDISQLLAPPIQYCDYGRCNIPHQQVLYCATSEAGAYWETRPRRGDVISLSLFELKPKAKVNCAVVRKERRERDDNNPLKVVANLLEEFMIDAYSLEVSKNRPRDYLFSALLASEQLFYPIVSKDNIEAIIYPSVQKKKFGMNFAIRNDIIFERYNLIGVETRFILDEYENLNPESEEVTTDQLIGSFGTNAFDFTSGKILYNEEKIDEIFNLFRELQVAGGKQVRYEHPGAPKNLTFNLSPKAYLEHKLPSSNPKKLERNVKVDVVYQDGTRIDNIKYKKVSDDISQGKCRIVNY